MRQKGYSLKAAIIGLFFGLGWSIISIYNSYVTTSSEIAQYQVLLAPLKIILSLAIGVVVGVIYKKMSNESNVL